MPIVMTVFDGAALAATLAGLVLTKGTATHHSPTAYQNQYFTRRQLRPLSPEFPDTLMLLICWMASVTKRQIGFCIPLASSSIRRVATDCRAFC